MVANAAMAVLASVALVAGRGLARPSQRRGLTGSTALRAKRKRRTSIGPKKLKSGYWQETDEDDDIDIFEWISAEDLVDEPPAALSGVREVAAYSQLEGLPMERFDAPEYRPPERPLQLQKGIKRPPPLDQDRDRSFVHDVAESISSRGPGPYKFDGLDVFASLQSLKVLVAYIDGSLTRDMRAKGLNTRIKSEPVPVDLMRIVRMPEAPNAIGLATVWNWVPANATANTGALNRMSYDVSFERAATGRPLLTGPPSTRGPAAPLHYRVLESSCGGLRMLVRAPTVAMAPSVDLGALEGKGVELASVNRRDVGDLWSSSLSSRYAEMQLADTGMIVRGVVDKGSLTSLQEVTREDLRLDRPAVADDADRIFGKLTGLLRRVRAVADCPGCKDRPLYLQYHDADLRIIAPILDDLDDLDVDDKAVKEVLDFVAGGLSSR